MEEKTLKSAAASMFGMAAFAAATAMLSFHFARIIAINSAIMAVVLTMGFAAPFLAGIFEHLKGNHYHATGFVITSLFFLSLFLFWNTTLGTVVPDNNSLGIFFIIWTIFTCCMLAGTIYKKMNKQMITLQIILGSFMAFTLVLAIAYFTGARAAFITAGAFGFLAAAAVIAQCVMHVCDRLAKDMSKMSKNK